MIAISTLGLLSCGKITPATVCTANFFEGDFSAKVSAVPNTPNTYEFEICTNSSFIGSQITVYGTQLETDIAGMNLNTQARLSHLNDGLHAGDTFDVTFSANDSWFVIYTDDINGNYSNLVEVLRGQFR